MGQDLPAMSDFNLETEYSWTSEKHSVSDAQTIQIWLLDAEGNRIAGGGHRDPWIKSYGTTDFFIGDEAQRFPPDSAPPAGVSHLSILREGDQVQVLWNGEPMLSGYRPEPLARIEVVFGFKAFSGSTFGTESIRTLELSGNTIRS